VGVTNFFFKSIEGIDENNTIHPTSKL